MPERYRFLLRPRWILSHLFVVALVVAMISLGFWQLRRLDEKKVQNRRVRERMSAPAVPIGAVLQAGFNGRGRRDADRAEFRRVTAHGTYRADQEVLVRSRSLDGAPGSWVLTPLVQGNGTAVVVNRGWVANDGREDAVPAHAQAPSGQVRITGVLQLTQTRGSFGPTDPTSGRLTNLARADIGRIQAQVPEKLVPAYVQLQSQSPLPGDRSPRLLPDPTVDEGPHLSYAIQWFAFSAMALFVYPLILRRAAREKEKPEMA